MILLQNIGKFYYTETSVTQALRKINLKFDIGEFVAITGESGSGKSTLLNIISGMDTFDDGEMYFNGQPTFQFDAADWEDFRREQIGFVFQDYSLIEHYSVLDNVASALLIMGADKKAARERAAIYLEKVGLKGLENRRSSELSSGQKQRLSIARALAKETRIIVADEPTGNLDSETGGQIIALLKELSSDRLILMVTHNYEQAEPYVTRKIRLHDGEVVVDVKVNTDRDQQKEDQLPTSEYTENTQPDAEEKDGTAEKNRAYKNRQKAIARTFAQMNTRTQKGRSLLFRVFFLFTAVVSFIMIGQLYKCADDTYTKNYDKKIYYQKNDSRLSVRRKDGKELTDGDIKKMQSIKYVEQADSQDLAADINYYVEEGKDYVYHHEVEEEDVEMDMWGKSLKSTYASEDIPEFNNHNKFMRSSDCIDESDLSDGCLPETRNQIVVYPTKKVKIGDTIPIYFTAENIWEGQYYLGQMTVTGFLKDETTQIYFHPDFCSMLAAPASGDSITIKYYYDKRSGYIGQDHFYLTIGDDLKEQQEADSSNIPYARPSRNYVPNLEAYTDSGMPVQDPVELAFAGNDEITVTVDMAKDYIPKALADMNEKPSQICVLGETGSRELTEKNLNHHSGNFLEVSQEVFNKYYPRRSTQASVYIKNYTKTDSVLRALDKMGYEGISTYRIASVSYNEDKVMERLTFLVIIFVILILLFAAEILILRSIMKIRIKDFFVMKSMGMQLPLIHQISFYEMTRYCVEAILMTVIIMNILNLSGIRYISTMMIYYGFIAAATYVLYNVILELATVRSFNRLLTGKMTR